VGFFISSGKTPNRINLFTPRVGVDMEVKEIAAKAASLGVRSHMMVIGEPPI
jgi:hypothetical protein